MVSAFKCMRVIVLFSVCCTVFINVCGSEAGAKVSQYSFDFVMKELMKQRVDLEKLQTKMENILEENADLKRRLDTERLENVEQLEAQKAAVHKQATHVQELREAQKIKVNVLGDSQSPSYTMASIIFVHMCSRTTRLTYEMYGAFVPIGSSYIRWGRTTCADNSSVLYKGYAAGAKYNDDGAGANILCLHDQPQWSRYLAGVHSFGSNIYGVEYRMFDGINNVFSYANNGGQRLLDHSAPCVMCYTPTRSTTIMIPARTECPADWVKEYQGYIVSDSVYPGHKRREYICWDQAPETALGASSQDQALIYSVEVMCGSLPCSRYPNGLELTCVVCSK